MSWLLLFKDIINVRSGNCSKSVNTRCGQNAELLDDEAFGTQLCFKGLTMCVF